MYEDIRKLCVFLYIYILYIFTICVESMFHKLEKLFICIVLVKKLCFLFLIIFSMLSIVKNLFVKVVKSFIKP